jgi:hypothetical protein
VRVTSRTFLLLDFIPMTFMVLCSHRVINIATSTKFFNCCHVLVNTNNNTKITRMSSRIARHSSYPAVSKNKSSSVSETVWGCLLSVVSKALRERKGRLWKGNYYRQYYYWRTPKIILFHIHTTQNLVDTYICTYFSSFCDIDV